MNCIAWTHFPLKTSLHVMGMNDSPATKKEEPSISYYPHHYEPRIRPCTISSPFALPSSPIIHRQTAHAPVKSNADEIILLLSQYPTPPRIPRKEPTSHTGQIDIGVSSPLPMVYCNQAMKHYQEEDHDPPNRHHQPTQGPSS